MFIRSITATLVALSLAGAAQAATYDFQFTSTVTSAASPGISTGDTMTLDMLVNNGGSTSANQTWLGADVVGFTIHAGSFVGHYSTPFEPASLFKFTSDAGGVLNFTEFYGTDYSSHNSDSFSSSFDGDFVFGNAAFFDSQSRGNFVAANGFTNPSFWKSLGAVSAVPEPSSIALTLAALAGFALTRRRRA